jgi:hypothetical protein
MKSPNVVCKFCKKNVYTPKYRIKTFKYCSKSCQGKDVRVEHETICNICNKKFVHISSRCNKAKYCSRKCYHKSQIGKGNKEFKCKYCNNIFFDSASTNRVYCSRKCINKEQKEIFKPSYTTVRKCMVVRNMINECEKCKYNEIPQILGIHHIDKNRNNNCINNLMVLCPNCHSIEHLKHISH